jgi:sulfur-oxidizing protein SoxY
MPREAQKTFGRFEWHQISRRSLLAAAAGAATAMMAGRTALAAADEEPTVQYQDAYRKLVGDRPVTETSVKVDLPDHAENGNMVPFAITVDSPMTDASHVRTITILSTGNPQPVIATFRLSPVSGRAAVAGRLRLARTQDVIVVCELNDGSFVYGSANVKVTVGGCGAG